MLNGLDDQPSPCNVIASWKLIASLATTPCPSKYLFKKFFNLFSGPAVNFLAKELSSLGSTPSIQGFSLIMLAMFSNSSLFTEPSSLNVSSILSLDTLLSSTLDSTVGFIYLQAS